jgi:hypothetical protein
MPAFKIAVTVPENVLKRARAQVEAGQAKTLSSLVSEANRGEGRAQRALGDTRCDGRGTRVRFQGSQGMGKASPRAIVLDAGALIVFERGDARMRALCREAAARGANS